VRTVHDGALAAGGAHAFEVDVTVLPAGNYGVVVTGAAFAATRRATVLR
jgi:hypothetical protein